MAQFTAGRAGWLKGASVAGWLIGAGLVGCNRQAPAPAQAESAAARTPAASQAPAAHDETESVAAVDPKLGQSFTEATRSEPPADGARPPDSTMTGKSVGRLFTEVERSWNTIRLVTEDGRRLAYTATLDTQLGPIKIALNAQLAPNHVRNFVALANAGYYDGLVFQRTVREHSAGQPDLELIEGGCPVGTGEAGVGSLGYWLRPEFNDAAHEEGTVGMCHGEEPDTACCKFYVTLNKAPYLDKNFTVFGKVTQGLDVARRIFSLPVRNDAEYPEGDRPEKPVVIHKVTIQARVVESADTSAAAK